MYVVIKVLLMKERSDCCGVLCHVQQPDLLPVAPGNPALKPLVTDSNAGDCMESNWSPIDAIRLTSRHIREWLIGINMLVFIIFG